ncbi:MAG: proprotein convertase P-domain-containing protein [Bacteroidota bacterium]
MKKISFFFLLIVLLYSHSIAQSYTSSGASIPDHGSPLQIPILISALDSATLTTNYGLEHVCININHTADRDLAIYLMSPNGTTVELCSGNGGLNDNYIATCFDMNATQLISAGTPPFTGDFIPEHSLGSFNDGQMGNGIWRLIITDYVVGDTGSLIDFTLTFGYSPAPPISISIGPCDDYTPTACQCPDGDSSCWLLPDILTATSMLQDTFWQRESFNQLMVTNSCANVGFGPMELIGTGVWTCNDSIVGGPGLCPDGQFAKQRVKQRVFIKNAGVGFFDFIDTLVGNMQFHSDLGHNHLHIDDWAVNTIRIRGPQADIRTWPIIGTGTKVSFCIYDHLICGGTFANCQYGSDMHLYSSLPNNGLGNGFTSCGTSIQGLSVGYSDIYDWSLAGQEIRFDSICNGNYFLVTEFDPNNRFLDGDRSNNISIVPITLKQQIPNCCHAKFRIDTLNYNENIYQFVDLTTPMPDHWLWNFGNGQTDTTPFPIINFNDATELHVSLTTSNNSACSDSTSITILVHTDISDTCNADFLFTSTGLNCDLYYPDSTQHIQEIHFDMSREQYISIDSFSRFHLKIVHENVPMIVDTITCNVLDSFGCLKKTSQGVRFFGEGIAAMQTNYHISLAPNPAKNETFLSYELNQPTTISIQLYNASGQIVETLLNDYKQVKGNYQYKIGLPQKGFYLVRTKFNNMEHIEKIFSY